MLPLLLLLGAANASVCSNNQHGTLTCDGEIHSENAWAYNPRNFDDHQCSAGISTGLTGGESYYRFECPYDGPVTVVMNNPTCDVDLFVYLESCAVGDCIDRNTARIGAANDEYAVDFDCTTGDVYWIMTEAYGPWRDFNPLGECSFIGPHPTGAGPFGLSAFSPITLEARCVEQCDDGLDNDIDGLTDCDDPDCPCVEECDVPGDEDQDGLADCADPDCASTAQCCDRDGDGYDADTVACGFGGDCADADPNRNPGVPEVVGDGIDQDCSGGDTCYADADGDGFGSTATVVSPNLSCAQAGEADNSADCADTGPGAAQIFPQAPDAPGDGVDADCDGVDNCYRDLDDDGFGSDTVVPGDDLTCDDSPDRAAVAGDCIDVGANAADVFPTALERCNNRDDDCDGAVDDADDDVIDGTTWWWDGDGDGFAGSDLSQESCVAPPNSYATATDCNDGNVAVFPAALERCNTFDDDCDGRIDDDDDLAELFEAWPDLDGDTWGADGQRTELNACSLPPGFAARPGDCDDADLATFAGATEVPYDGIDQDCDGTDLDDVDGDGVPGGLLGLDCDDTNAERAPGLPEQVNGTDDDCDGIVDEGTEAFDDDGDGFAELGGDCNDADPTRFPGAAERVDGRDDDCDGVADEGTDAYDDDGDGFAETQGDCNDHDASVNPGAIEVIGDGTDNDCDGSLGVGGIDEDGDGYSAFSGGGDCDDTDSTVFPFATELRDGLDNDCDGRIDNDTTAWDDDGDGFTEIDGDCDDADVARFPGALERQNSIDDDCDGVIDNDTVVHDDDGDGVSDEAGDCDDTDPLISPLAEDVLDGIDNDCDGIVDDGADADGDGWTPERGDCDDNQGWSNPEATEVCDFIDNDCDGEIDEVDCESGRDEPEAQPEPTRGCDQSGGFPVGWLALLPLALLRRRAR